MNNYIKIDESLVNLDKISYIKTTNWHNQIYTRFYITAHDFFDIKGDYIDDCYKQLGLESVKHI